MFVFWLAVVCMVAVSLFVVLRPLLRRQAKHGIDATVARVNIFRNRLQEMETEVSNGVMSSDDAEVARTELARTLLQETDTVNIAHIDPKLNPSRHWWSAGVIAVLVPVLAVFLYLRLGTPAFVGSMVSPHEGSAGGKEHNAAIEDMVKRLADRLEQNPDDPEGWMMLVNSYMTLGRHEDALKAIQRLYQITGDQPPVLVRYADVLATVKGGDLSGQPSELVQKALKLDPENAMGLWLAGMAAAQSGNPGTAIDYWQRLLPLLASDQASQKEVSDLIARAREQMGGAAVTTVPASTAGTEVAAAVPANSALTIKVSLSPGISQDISPGQALFIVAKAVNGPPMPVAVIRKTAADLPLEVTMDDNNAMMPSRKLSSFVLVDVSARISPSGNAIPQSGDLVSATLSVSPGQPDPVVLVIDRKVP
jgi:cytochrome c-type biogenesis protein CcmH